MRIALAVDKLWLVNFLKDTAQGGVRDEFDVLHYLSIYHDLTIIPLNGENLGLDTSYRYLLNRSGLENVKVAYQKKPIICDVCVTTTYWRDVDNYCKFKTVYHMGGTLTGVSTSYGVKDWVCLLGEIQRLMFREKSTRTKIAYSKAVHVYR